MATVLSSPHRQCVNCGQDNYSPSEFLRRDLWRRPLSPIMQGAPMNRPSHPGAYGNALRQVAME